MVSVIKKFFLHKTQQIIQISNRVNTRVGKHFLLKLFCHSVTSCSKFYVIEWVLMATPYDMVPAESCVRALITTLFDPKNNK